jgi:hypothetical protein
MHNQAVAPNNGNPNVVLFAGFPPKYTNIEGNGAYFVVQWRALNLNSQGAVIPRMNPTTGLYNPTPAGPITLIEDQGLGFTSKYSGHAVGVTTDNIVYGHPPFLQQWSVGGRPVRVVVGGTEAHPILSWVVRVVVTPNGPYIIDGHKSRNGRAGMNTAKSAATILVLLFSTLLIAACSRSAGTAVENTPGCRWLQMSSTERAELVGAFMDGYQLASIQACGLLEGVFKVDNVQLLEQARHLDLTPSELCRKEAGEFSRVRPSSDGSRRYEAYINEITAFYQHHPDHKYVSPDALLVKLKDGEDSTAEELYRDYK